MKKSILFLVLSFIFLTTKFAAAQTCHQIHTGYKSVPDTGAVYPASLAQAIAGVPYSQVMTIGVPSKATLPTIGAININWIKLKSLKNAPSGMVILDSTGGTNYGQMNKLTWNCFTINWPNPVEGTYAVQIVADVNITKGITYTMKDYATTSFNIVVKPNYVVDGIVNYDNAANTVLKGVTLELKNKTNDIVATKLTDSLGYYMFDRLDTGKYSITALYDKVVGDINPIDALLINRNYIKLYTFTDNLKAKSADVNIDNKINPIDALQLNRFYIKVIPSFLAGKWLFESPVINIKTGNITQNIKGICIGDVNGSYKP